MISSFQKIAPPRKKSDISRILPWIWLAVAYCSTIAFLSLYGRPYIDSDMAGEMVLSNFLNQEGSLLSTNWGYSSEIRIFYLQLIYRITLLIFPHNWYAARVLGQAIWIALLLLCVMFVARSLHLPDGGVWAAAVLACPFGSWYFWYGAFGGQYTVYMIMLLFSLGLSIRLFDSSSRKKQFVYAVLLAASCFVFSLGTMKIIMALYLPMVVASLFLVIYAWHRNPDVLPEKEFKFFAVSIGALLVSGIGYIINTHYLAAKYHFASHNDRTWGQFNLSSVLDTLSDFLSLFGFPSGKLFSLYGILGAFSFVTVFVILFSIVCSVAWFKKATFFEQLLLSTFLSSMLVQTCVFAFTQGSDVPNGSYWLTPMPLLLLLLESVRESFPFRLKWSKSICSVCFLLCVCATSITTVHNFIADPVRAVPTMESAEEWLVENDFSYGYATFWKANVLNEWSSGQLKTYAISGDTLDPSDLRGWLEPLTPVPHAGKVFLLLTADELWGAHKESLRNDYNVYWDENDYLVMAFDSYDEMVSAIENAHSD